MSLLAGLLVAVNIGLAGADAGQTASLLARGGYREGNPVWGSLPVSHPGVFGFIRVGVSSSVATTVWAQRNRHPKAAVACLVGMAVAQGLVVAHNARVARR